MSNLLSIVAGIEANKNKLIGTDNSTECKVLFISKFEKMKDIRLFSSELGDEWAEHVEDNIDNENKWYSDEIEAEFYTEAAIMAGFVEWELDYLMYCSGF